MTSHPPHPLALQVAEYIVDAPLHPRHCYLASAVNGGQHLECDLCNDHLVVYQLGIDKGVPSPLELFNLNTRVLHHKLCLHYLLLWTIPVIGSRWESLVQWCRRGLTWAACHALASLNTV